MKLESESPNNAENKNSAPWYLQDSQPRVRNPIVKAGGALRRQYATVRVAYLVIKKWWHSPPVIEPPTNGSILMSRTIGGVSRPLLWISSVFIAGIIGSEVSTSGSNFNSAKSLAIWIVLAFVAILASAIYQWCKFLNQLRTALISWVKHSSSLEIRTRNIEDVALFGYTIDEGFRKRFQPSFKGVIFLGFASFILLMLITAMIGHWH